MDSGPKREVWRIQFAWQQSQIREKSAVNWLLNSKVEEMLYAVWRWGLALPKNRAS